MTSALSLVAMLMVSSVDPESTTMIRLAMGVTDSMVRAMVGALLQAMMATSRSSGAVAEFAASGCVGALVIVGWCGGRID